MLILEWDSFSFPVNRPPRSVTPVVAPRLPCSSRQHLPPPSLPTPPLSPRVMRPLPWSPAAYHVLACTNLRLPSHLRLLILQHLEAEICYAPFGYAFDYAMHHSPYNLFIPSLPNTQSPNYRDSFSSCRTVLTRLF